MKRFAVIACLACVIALFALPQQADAQISNSTLIAKTDTTKAYYHSIGYAVGSDQRVNLRLSVPHTSVTADWVAVAFKADTTNVWRVYKGTPTQVIENVRLDSVYVGGSTTGLTFYLLIEKQ